MRAPGDEAGGRSPLGAPAFSLSDAVCAKVVAEACRLPSDVGIPVTHWSLTLLGDYLRQNGWELSDSTVGRILRQAQLQPHRQKMWLTSQDDEFRQKRDAILHLYYDTPEAEHLICVDEKTSIQALERCAPDLPMCPNQVIRREFEYLRHGTLCLMGALDVRRGKLFGFTCPGHNGPTFVQLLDLIDLCYPTGRGHIVCDNLSAHLTDEVLEWFEEHPRWTQHFTPKHASWLNQIECAFSILHERVLKRGSFTSLQDLQEKLYAYMLWHNETAQPFKWSYRPKSWEQKPAQTSGQRH
jgi:transposase